MTSITFQEDADMRLLSHDVSQSCMLLSTYNAPCVLGSASLYFAATPVMSSPLIDEREASPCKTPSTIITACASIQCSEPRKWATFKRPFEVRIEIGGRATERHRASSSGPLRSDSSSGSNKALIMSPLLSFQCLKSFDRAGDTARACCAQFENTTFKVDLIRATWQCDATSCQTQWRITAETTEPDTYWSSHSVRLIVTRFFNDDGRATVVRVCAPARTQLLRLCAALHSASNEGAALAAAQQLVTAFFYCARVQTPFPDWFTHAEAAAMQLRKTTPALADVPEMLRHTMFESAWLGIATAAVMDVRRVPLCKRLLPSDAQCVMRTMDALATQVAHYETALGHVPLSCGASASSGQWLDQIRSVGETLCIAITSLS